MKKKTDPKTTVKKTAPKARTRRTKIHVSLPVITIRRFIIVSSFVLGLGMMTVLFIIPNKPDLQQAVAGLSITRGLYAEATVGWEPELAAVSYNIYYKEVGEEAFSNAVREIPASVTTYTIQFLNKDTTYLYKVAAVDADGSEYKWSGVKEIVEFQGM